MAGNFIKHPRRMVVVIAAELNLPFSCSLKANDELEVKMKKFIASILAIALVLSCSATAFADYDNTDNGYIASSEQNIVPSVPQQLISRPNALNPNVIVTRGSTLPTEAYEFDGTSPYSGSFSGVSGGLYTNYYFTGHTKYYVSFDNVSVTSNCNFVFYLYDMTTRSMVGAAKSYSFSSSSSSNEAYASYNTYADHNYCVFFRTDYTARASGNIYVSYAY